MTDEATTTAAASADAQPSQIIQPDSTDASAQGQGAKLPEVDAPKEEEKKPLSTRDAIAKAFDESEAKAKEKAEKPTDEKAEKDAKAEKPDKTADAEDGEKVEAKSDDKPKAEKQRAEDGKFAKADKGDEEQTDDKSAPEKAAAGQGGDDARQSEGRKHAEPPSRFLLEAAKKWANVPNEVKAEFHRVSQEMESEITKHKQASERYEQFRQYDEVAKANGRDFATDSIPKVIQFETMMRQNPLAAIDFALREAGPRKNDGSPLSLYEVAQHVAKLSPEQFQNNMRGAQPQGQPQQQNGGQASPEMRAVMQQLQSIQSELAVTKTRPVIDSFKAERPDFDAVEPKMIEILETKVIDKIYGTGLTPEQKLAEAYRMAGGQHSPSQSALQEPAPVHSQADTRPDIDPDGQKSIKGAPSSGQTGETQRKFKSNRAALEAAFDLAR